MILFQNIDVYAPEYLGRKDVLTVYDKIVKIADAGTITADGLLSGAETVDGTGLVLTPGFVDCHVHVLGGGGEGGFANRTPEATMEGLNKFGVTTVVGCLGTDGIGRDMCALVAKTKGLREQGMSAWCYTGSYQVPVRTLTDGITKDIMMIEEIIGTGEIAISADTAGCTFSATSFIWGFSLYQCVCFILKSIQNSSIQSFSSCWAWAYFCHIHSQLWSQWQAWAARACL